jgi:hypothetical protein
MINEIMVQNLLMNNEFMIWYKKILVERIKYK